MDSSTPYRSFGELEDTGGGAPIPPAISVLLRFGSSYLVYADVWLHILMTHHHDRYDVVVHHSCSLMPGKQCESGNEVQLVGAAAFADSGNVASYVALVVKLGFKTGNNSSNYNHTRIGKNAFEEFRGSLKVFDTRMVRPENYFASDNTDALQSTKWATFDGSTSLYRVIGK